MTIDVIIVSDAKNPMLKRMTQNAILSLHNSDGVIKFNPIVIEAKNVIFNGAKTYGYDFPFNYNKCLNYGASKCSNDIILFCNNDLIFSHGFMRGLLMAFKMGYKSVSPINPGCMWHKGFKVGNQIIEGYQTGVHVAGWCIGMTRDAYNRIGGFDETVSFWYSDNLYCEQIKTANVKHCLVCNSVVFHIESKTLETKGVRDYHDMTEGQKKKYNIAKERYNI